MTGGALFLTTCKFFFWGPMSAEMFRPNEGQSRSSNEDLAQVNKMLADQPGIAAPAEVKVAAPLSLNRSQAVEYVRSLRDGTLEDLTSGVKEREHKALENVPALIAEKGIALTFFMWAKNNPAAFAFGGKEKDSVPGARDAFNALTRFLANPKRFLEIAPQLGECDFSKALCERIQPEVSDLQSENEALAEFFYHRFLTTDTFKSQEITARFLSKLDTEKLTPHLIKDLDNKELSPEARILIANLLGQQAKADRIDSTVILASEALLSHVFPKPYNTPTECFGANTFSFVTRLVGGVVGGGFTAGIIARFLPKSVFITPEVILLGAAVATFFALKSLYTTLNRPLVENVNPDVQLAAAKGLAAMLNSPSLKPEIRAELSKTIESYIDKASTHEIAGILREGLSGRDHDALEKRLAAIVDDDL
jgi:hypothetical protein